MLNPDAIQRLWLGADVSTLRAAGRLIDEVHDYVGVVKVGLQLMHRVGTPHLLKSLRKRPGIKLSVFADAKVEDIPRTVGEAVRAIADQGVDFLNMQSWAGPKAIEEAVKHKGSSKLLLVTVLSSLTPDNLYYMFVQRYPGAKPFESLTPEDRVKYLQDVTLDLAIMSAEYGGDGVICSGQELRVLAQDSGLNGFERYATGIRPEWAPEDDHSRTMTPAEAIREGATGVILSRPIRNPPKKIGKPREAARRVVVEIDSALPRPTS